MASERGRDSVPRNELPVRLSNTKWIYIYIYPTINGDNRFNLYVCIHNNYKKEK